MLAALNSYSSTTDLSGTVYILGLRYHGSDEGDGKAKTIIPKLAACSHVLSHNYYIERCGFLTCGLDRHCVNIYFRLQLKNT